MDDLEWHYLAGDGDFRSAEIKKLRDEADIIITNPPTQTAAAEARAESNCPLCAIGQAANQRKIWKLSEMDADHVAAWSKGGTTHINNCQMLCKTHNRAKGNR